MAQTRPNFDPATGDDTTGALRKLDNNCVDLDTRVTAAQGTANAALPLSGGTLAGNVKTATSGGSLIVDGATQVLATANGNVAPLRVNSTPETGSSNPSAGAFMCFFRNAIQGGYFGLSGTGKLAWGGWSQGASEYPIFHAGENVVPSADNVRSLGSGSLRFTQLFAASGTINTSDINYKTDIANTKLGLDFVMLLRPVSYKLKEAEKQSTRVQTGFTTHFDGQVDAAGTPVLDADGNQVQIEVKTPIMEEVLTPRAGTRNHEGLISQEVAESLRTHGVDPLTCGIWTKSDPADPSSAEGLRYEEFVGPLIRAVQELSQANATLASRVAALEAKA